MTQDLKALYGAEAEAQRARYAALNTAFAEAFGTEAEALELSLIHISEPTRP